MVKNIIKRWFFSFSWILEFRFLFCFWENFFFTFFSFLDICNIHRKSMCWSLFLIKLKTWGHAFLSKKRLQHRRFSRNIGKCLRKTFLWSTFVGCCWTELSMHSQMISYIWSLSKSLLTQECILTLLYPCSFRITNVYKQVISK